MSLQRFLDLDSRAHDLLFSCLSEKDLIGFSKLNSVSLSSIQGYHKRAYNIHRRLSRYFKSAGDIDKFRWLRAKTGLIISGSTALQFFDRTLYEESDMDLYVQDSFCREVSHFLVATGYEFVPRDYQGLGKTLDQVINGRMDKKIDTAEPLGDEYDDDVTHGIARVFDFHLGERKIQLITAVKTPFDVIFRYHSTVVLNFITHKAAYSLYPYDTFIKRRLVGLLESEKADIALEKYNQRGWSYHFPMTYWQPRWIGDHRCWMISLPELDPILGVSDGDSLAVPDTVGINSWALVCHPSTSIQHMIMEDPLLKLAYTAIYPEEDDPRQCEIALVICKAMHAEEEGFIDEALLGLIKDDSQTKMRELGCLIANLDI
ncbi:hypothetical protein C8J56DRAFT_931784 [Mycena floridula]|nr:hypothetical protein C8J56DRAFT_931784 [Mycena floridula]